MRILPVLLLAAMVLRGEVAAVRVEGAVPAPFALTPAALQKLDRAAVSVEENGRTIRYEGVWLHQVLAAAGAAVGPQAKGSALASYVLVQAADGYQVVFSLTELNPAFADHEILLAERENGAPLDAKSGPFRIIAPREKRHARWIRNVRRIEVVQLYK